MIMNLMAGHQSGGQGMGMRHGFGGVGTVGEWAVV